LAVLRLPGIFDEDIGVAVLFLAEIFGDDIWLAFCCLAGVIGKDIRLAVQQIRDLKERVLGHSDNPSLFDVPDDPDWCLEEYRYLEELEAHNVSW